MLLAVDIPQAIVDHAIDEFAIAIDITLPGLQEIVRHIGHALKAADRHHILTHTHTHMHTGYAPGERASAAVEHRN